MILQSDSAAANDRNTDGFHELKSSITGREYGGGLGKGKRTTRVGCRAGSKTN